MMADRNYQSGNTRRPFTTYTPRTYSDVAATHSYNTGHHGTRGSWEDGGVSHYLTKEEYAEYTKMKQFYSEYEQKRQAMEENCNTLWSENETLKERCNQYKKVLKQLEAELDTKDKQLSMLQEPATVEDDTGMQNIKTKMQELYAEIERQHKRHASEMKRLKIDQTSRSGKYDDDQDTKSKLTECQQLLKETSEEKKKCEEVAIMLDKQKKQLEDRILHLQKENDDLSDRLSQEMNTKVSSDESNVENISIKSRPMNISGEYHSFISGEWLELKETLDERFETSHYPKTKETEKDILQCLCEIMIISEKKAKDFQKATLDNVLLALQNPGRRYRSNSLEESTCPPVILNAVSDFLRMSADTTNLSQLEEETLDGIIWPRSMNQTRRYGKVRESFTNYIRGVVKLAWKMVNQRPPMTFKMPGIGKAFKESVQEPNWGSAEPGPNTVVGDYVHPALFHGDKLMAKGKVMLVIDLGHGGNHGETEI